MNKVKVSDNEKVNGITVENWKKFDILMGDMSPENVCCDGEISRAEANRRYSKLVKRWHALEKEVGRKVDELEVIDVAMSVDLY